MNLKPMESSHNAGDLECMNKRDLSLELIVNFRKIRLLRLLLIIYRYIFDPSNLIQADNLRLPYQTCLWLLKVPRSLRITFEDQR